ncbi:helix-turn-helix transcriptional regulator [Streptomyces sp. WI04-05B]|uniref:helix-turn-helix transcriptional regulator n=1 Tax=Streptomyces TaxID=1883 RepID=UPI0029B11864|nr:MULTISPECIES: AAA family ATPase [unclassified Streptomyces]MDX2546268.1 AAA family ATPase [Streptomyces sp. WI04-05B]MDX2583291.1 AAA family ATPase [Streptomyces sp. WI04-05A]
MARRGSRAGLLGRENECEALDDLVAGARAGRSGVLVLRGEPGIGKTELLRHLLTRATGCRTIRAAGVQSEMELSYAGLHQLCAPLLAGLDQLPEPQRDALGTAFGLRAGAAPDRFLVGLAALSLIADAGGDQPLVCLVDDAQWLDEASALTLAFVARRLLAESVVLVFAVREPSTGHALGSLPELSVTGLTERDSRTLLDSVVTGPLDERVRDRIVAESRGNPLALLELPRGLTPAEMTGGFERPDAWPLASQIEQGFLRRVQELPYDSRRLLFIAAAEPLGDVTLLRRAAQRLGIDADTAGSHEGAMDLITLGNRVRFRHPLVRSAAYRGADPGERREVHRALADATDARLDPDRRAWHLADAASGPDETVAAELERSAGRAHARGGVAEAAAFLQRATALTPDPARRAQRALDAAQAKLHAGAFEPAATLLAMAAAGPLDELGRARTEVLRAGIAFGQSRGGEAPSLLLAAARRFGRLDEVVLARETYLDAIAAAIFAGRLARGPGLLEVGEAARAAPPARQPQVSDTVLDALTVRLTDGYPASAPMMERALEALCDERLPVQEQLRRLWFGSFIASDLWDDEHWHAAATRHVMVTREAGALSALPDALDSRVFVHLIAGELAAAGSLIEETAAVCAATGNSSTPRLGPLGLAVWRGREGEARTLIDEVLVGAVPRGQGAIVTVTRWYEAVLCNGLGQYPRALAAAREAAAEQREFTWPRYSLAELIEAAVRSGSPDSATDALERLSEATRASGTDWALGVEARSRALLSEGDTAERLYREAIERLGRTRVRMELARAHLLYGEWLRRENRRVDARAQLDIAHEMFSRFEALAFAERARGELQATGAKVRTHTVATPTALTSQEAQIARLAGKGLTNPEIGAQLFISRHTVEWHLRKVFSKLGISSRREIRAIQFDGEATSA